MNISYRGINGRKYAEVTVIEGSTTIETSFLDQKEADTLAINLREVADDLSPDPRDAEILALREQVERQKKIIDDMKTWMRTALASPEIETSTFGAKGFAIMAALAQIEQGEAEEATHDAD